MKLVELLAKELKEWPEIDECSNPILFITQDSSGIIFSWNDNGELKFVDGQWYMQGTIPFDEVIFDGSETCSDCSSAIVSEDQWQSEREKMNKPKWIRHRGGKCPVQAGTKVSTKHRDGELFEVHHHTAQKGSSAASLNVVWKHNGDSFDIMAYRIIEETKDQEIEEVRKFSKDVDMNIGQGEIIHGPVSIGDTVITAAHPKLDTNLGTITYKLEIDATEATKEIDSLVAKWGQIESPLKWRDEIIELEAYEEEFRREREKLIRKLESEGLKLIDHMAPVYGEQIIDFSDCRNWQAGDIVECITDSDNGQFTFGYRYAVKSVNRSSVQIVEDDRGSNTNGWGASNFKFSSRP
ncbi:MAG: hypothetical protein [Bacteriophage sp.]|nr:MAG: hypothetical protein [Bacteriophage sp.]